MQILGEERPRGLSEPHAVAIGTFDGVHLGHRALIGLAKRRADELGIATAVVTFDPHPARLVRPDVAPLMLTGLDHRLELLAELEVDTTFVVRFDQARVEETAEGFVQSVLVESLAARSVVVGADFRFGKGRGGDVGLLRSIGEEAGFVVDGLDLVPRPDDQSGQAEPVSSTLIRRAVAAGDLATATRLLGRFHELRGPVTSGDQRGRTIGFPTANVAVPQERALPADGVYAAWYVRPDGSRHPAAVNIGKRPTFYDNAEHSLVEAHLIDFSGDLYDEQARVLFVERLRPEQRFDGIDALSAQLQADIAQARAVLL
jgi:riboflavin kinase/FMN adenylyltransferase